VLTLFGLRRSAGSHPADHSRERQTIAGIMLASRRDKAG
jgi:hypothetical protein